MMKLMLQQWERNKDHLLSRLINFLKSYEDTYYSITYRDLVELIFDAILNDDEENFDYKVNVKNITEIDDGDYQGTVLYMIPFDSYQPAEYEYFLTYIGYGSCSGCDTLLGILEEENKEQQLNDFLKLSLDIISNTIHPYNSGWRNNDPNFEPIEWKDN